MRTVVQVVTMILKINMQKSLLLLFFGENVYGSGRHTAPPCRTEDHEEVVIMTC